MAKSRARHGWTATHAAMALLLMAAGLLAMRQPWVDIVRIARIDEESSHIFLVPVVVAWLIWVRRGRFRLCQPRGMWIGPILVVLGWIISTWGFRNAVQSFWHGGAVVVVVGCLLTVVGTDVLLRFFPAFAVLIFLVPIPGMIRQQIAIPLQTATAQVTQVLFELLGIPVERSGNLLSINNIDVTIAEACNGMRMVFALVLVSYAFAFGEPLRNYARLLILAASPISAVACNVIRMLPTLWLYGYGSRHIADKFHDASGWIMLMVAFLLLMSIIRILRWAMIPVAHYTLASD
ncbi:MAG: exosortase/archaeosortase family protein [Bacillota bacterium]